MTFEKELVFFEAHRLAWISEGREGEWCVIHGDELLGFFSSPGEAYFAGADKFGEDAPLLVKQVLPEDPIETFQRVHWSANDQRASQA